MQELLDQVQYRVLFAVGFFVICLIVCNVWIYLARPRGLSLKIIDYVWLSLASIALLTTAADQRRLIAQNLDVMAKGRLQIALDRVATAVRFNRHYACDFAWSVSPMTPPEGIARFNATESACRWFESLEGSLSASQANLQTFVEQTRLEPPIEVRDAWRSEVQDVASAFADARAAVTDYAEFASSRGQIPLEKVLTYFAPYLLAIGLALRFAKVTGELRLS